VKISYEVCKREEKIHYFVINTENSWPELELATGNPDLKVRITLITDSGYTRNRMQNPTIKLVI
jgi:hypothetical protein